MFRNQTLNRYTLSNMQLPFRINDLLLLVVVLSSMAVGIIFPRFGSLFQSLPIYCLMVLFALSYLSGELDAVWRTLKDHSKTILTFTVLKSLILPVVVFYIFNVFPDLCPVLIASDRCFHWGCGPFHI